MEYLKELKSTIQEKLPELDLVIGWKQGFDPVHASPCFMRTPEEVEQLVVTPLCVQNLATYLPGLKGKKVGIVARECDTRSIGELLQESLIDREQITVFSVKCPGAIDLVKFRQQVGNLGLVTAVDFDGPTLKVQTQEDSVSLNLDDLLPAKCLSMAYAEPVLADFRFADPNQPTVCREAGDRDLEALEGMSLDERFAYWQGHLDRCVRCHACRNVCPMCVCQDQCIAETRDPHWLTAETDVQQKWMFQLIHAMHLAGRCTECGECERACPMNIPILTIRRKLNREIEELFGYTSGMDVDAVPPLLTFQPEEKTISEREW